jgi:hypothetical protein
VIAGVLDAADSVWDTVLGPASASTEKDARAILRVLAYCYANGIYASTEVEAAMNADPILLYLAGGHRHESTEFRRFRRRNLQAVQRCLARTLERTWTNSLSLSAADRLPSGDYARAALERWAENPPKPDFESEAADRVRKAICDDAALLDE